MTKIILINFIVELCLLKYLVIFILGKKYILRPLVYKRKGFRYSTIILKKKTIYDAI